MPERWNAGILKHGTPEYLNMERRNTLKKNARILKHGTPEYLKKRTPEYLNMEQL